MILYQFNEFVFCVISVMCHSFSSVPATIGFNQTTYSVRENAGSVTVSVSVMNGTISQDVIITLSTAPGGSATGGVIVLRSTEAQFLNKNYRISQSDTLATIFIWYDI